MAAIAANRLYRENSPGRRSDESATAAANQQQWRITGDRAAGTSWGWRWRAMEVVRRKSNGGQIRWRRVLHGENRPAVYKNEVRTSATDIKWRHVRLVCRPPGSLVVEPAADQCDQRRGHGAANTINDFTPRRWRGPVTCFPHGTAVRSESTPRSQGWTQIYIIYYIYLWGWTMMR